MWFEARYIDDTTHDMKLKTPHALGCHIVGHVMKQTSNSV